MIHSTAKVSEQVNINLSVPWNTIFATFNPYNNVVLFTYSEL